MLRLDGWLGAVAIATVMSMAAPALAQDQGGGVEWEDEQAPDTGVGFESQGSADLANPSLQEEQSAMQPETPRSPTDPYEDPTESYYFLGLFYRHTWTPAFVLKLFLDEITSANNPATGLEFTYRKDNLDIVATVYWQRYHDYGPFLASGDPQTNTEMIDSSLSMVGVGGNFLWSTSFNDVFAFEYGIDIGLGVVLGDLIRTEAYKTSFTPGPDDGAKAGWAPCEGPNNPVPSSGVTAGYCDEPVGAGTSRMPPTNIDGESGAHYHIKAKRWTDGGSVPNVWFRLALPHLALRIKPIKQLVMRVDFGFDLFSGFFLGAGVSVGLN